MKTIRNVAKIKLRKNAPLGKNEIVFGSGLAQLRLVGFLGKDILDSSGISRKNDVSFRKKQFEGQARMGSNFHSYLYFEGEKCAKKQQRGIITSMATVRAFSGVT